MQHLELAYLAVAYGMAGIMFFTTRYKTFPTLSHIAIDSKLTRQVFFWGLTIAGLLFAMLMYGWAVPHFGLGVGIQVLIGILVFCQIMTGFFPFEAPGLTSAHNIFATILAISMFVLIISFAFTPAIHETARIINGTLAASMVLLAATAKRVEGGEYLFHEKIFFGFWHAAIFATVYLG